MKYLKYILVAVIAILALNYFKVIDFDLGSKTKEATTVIVAKAKSEVEKLSLTKAVNKEVLDYVIEKGMPAKFSIKEKGVYSIKGDTLTGTFNSRTPRYVEISFNPADTTSINQAEGVISLFTGKKFEFVSSDLKDLTVVKVRINKEGSKFKVKSNLPIELEI